MPKFRRSTIAPYATEKSRITLTKDNNRRYCDTPQGAPYICRTCPGKHHNPLSCVRNIQMRCPALPSEAGLPARTGLLCGAQDYPECVRNIEIGCPALTQGNEPPQALVDGEAGILTGSPAKGHIIVDNSLAIPLPISTTFPAETPTPAKMTPANLPTVTLSTSINVEVNWSRQDWKGSGSIQHREKKEKRRKGKELTWSRQDWKG
ncbi:hypothetical protein PGT21_019732 [Puccinia graminis f. sp. tritici]|uniref:Uncharacterized protein n=1 Tax=Puccinia graminis f. sp. tritici TaxID=56615 RepID=A0A5B0QTJ3_PUCGR|nr:hypothetical protein PGT21_019732 [Puccinia graminis f. sp. tritici]